VAEEHAQVKEQLLTEKAALALWEGGRLEALELLELFEKMSRAYARRAEAIEKQTRALTKRLEGAESEHRWAQEFLLREMDALSPQLFAYYRISRQSPLAVLSTSADAASFMRRTRAMAALLSGGVERIGRVRRAMEFERRSADELRVLQLGLADSRAQLESQLSRSQLQRRELAEAVELLRAKANHSSRLIRELSRAEKQLSELISQLAETADSGFGALRGQLPFPAEGHIEVGFGKVVNPRFGTSTLQKGLDIRAPAGSPVRAIADGKVAYAGWLKGYGNILVVDHGDGYHTLMGHLAELQRQPGQPVRAGEVVGSVGDTGSVKGPYLYFELRKSGQAVDPTLWFSSRQ
jgi:septal ring factor EnvC (AmiA/AmiB activator)